MASPIYIPTKSVLVLHFFHVLTNIYFLVFLTTATLTGQFGYILCSWRRRSSIQLAKTRLGADCGSDNELLNAKFRLKWKKAGKTTRPFRCDLNQIPTVEVTNRFEGLDLIECLKNWRKFTILYRRWWSKPTPSKKKCKKTKWLFEAALQIA